MSDLAKVYQRAERSVARHGFDWGSFGSCGAGHLARVTTDLKIGQQIADEAAVPTRQAYADVAIKTATLIADNSPNLFSKSRRFERDAESAVQVISHFFLSAGDDEGAQARFRQLAEWSHDHALNA